MNNGYTTIKIDSKDIGIKFDYLAVKLFTKATKDKIDLYFTEDQSLTVYGVAKLLHTAYISNCERKETEPELKFEPFLEWAEEINDSDEETDKAEMVRVLGIYTDCSYSKKLVAAAEEQKKSLIQEAT